MAYITPDRKTTSKLPTEPISKYATLHEQGVKIEDELIDFIVNTISLGIQDTKTHFGRNDELNFITSDNQQSFGYAKGLNAVAIPLSTSLLTTPTVRSWDAV